MYTNFQNGNSELTLVDVKFSPGSRTFSPMRRGHEMQHEGAIVDEIISRIACNRDISIGYYGANMGVLSQPRGESTVAGGFNEPSKALMGLTFLIGDSAHVTKYLFIHGFVTNRPGYNEVSGDTEFHPQYEYIITETVKDSTWVDSNGITQRGLRPVCTVSERRNFMYLDGSEGYNDTYRAMSSANYVMSIKNKHQFMSRYRDAAGYHGSSSFLPADNLEKAAQSISKKNINPIQYTTDVLQAIMEDSNVNAVSDSHNDYGINANLPDTPYITRENLFLSHVADRGANNYRGSTFRDLSMAFENFKDLFFKADAYQKMNLERMGITGYLDYQEFTESLTGDSLFKRIVCCVLQNVLEITTSVGLSFWVFQASNEGSLNLARNSTGYYSCDHENKIEVISLDGASLADNDPDKTRRIEAAARLLESQIMVNLNGFGGRAKRYITMEVEVEVFGVTSIKASTMDSRGGEVTPHTFIFPTYAASRFSPSLASGNDSSDSIEKGYNQLYDRLVNYKG